MKKYILTASTTKYGWSFSCEGLSYKEYKVGDELPTGLFYIFESENDETARAIGQTNEPEYLIQSLVDGSDFYNNSRILAANLPKRNISLTMNTSTWEHSANNKEFIEKLTKLAIDELFK